MTDQQSEIERATVDALHNLMLEKLQKLSVEFRDLQAERKNALGPLIFACYGLGRRAGCQGAGHRKTLRPCPDARAREHDSCNCCDNCRDYCRDLYLEDQQKHSL